MSATFCVCCHVDKCRESEPSCAAVKSVALRQLTSQPAIPTHHQGVISCSSLRPEGLKRDEESTPGATASSCAVRGSIIKERVDLYEILLHTCKREQHQCLLNYILYICVLIKIRFNSPVLTWTLKTISAYIQLTCVCLAFSILELSLLSVPPKY